MLDAIKHFAAAARHCLWKLKWEMREYALASCQLGCAGSLEQTGIAAVLISQGHCEVHTARLSWPQWQVGSFPLLAAIGGPCCYSHPLVLFAFCIFPLNKLFCGWRAHAVLRL